MGSFDSHYFVPCLLSSPVLGALPWRVPDFSSPPERVRRCRRKSGLGFASEETLHQFC